MFADKLKELRKERDGLKPSWLMLFTFQGALSQNLRREHLIQIRILLKDSSLFWNISF